MFKMLPCHVGVFVCYLGTPTPIYNKKMFSIVMCFSIADPWGPHSSPHMGDLCICIVQDCLYAHIRGIPIMVSPHLLPAYAELQYTIQLSVCENLRTYAKFEFDKGSMQVLQVVTSSNPFPPHPALQHH